MQDITVLDKILTDKLKSKTLYVQPYHTRVPILRQNYFKEKELFQKGQTRT